MRRFSNTLGFWFGLALLVQSFNVIGANPRNAMGVSTRSEKHFLFDHEVDIELVNTWINYFTGDGRKIFQRHMDNGETYRYVVERLFEEQGLPIDLYYVGLIESGFNLKIKSHAKARGPWQFMSKTAQKYGLRINSDVDERTHIYKSTEAAALYLKDLHNIFYSWPLALAAYNSGEYRVMDAIKRGKTRHYQELCRLKLLPRETRNYVAKVIAAKQIEKNRKSFGFRNSQITEHLDPPLFKAVIRKPYDIGDLARQNEITLTAFKKYNPDIIGNQIRASVKRPFYIYLPQDSYKQKKNSLESFVLLPGKKAISTVLRPEKLKSLGMKDLKKGDSVELTSLGEGIMEVKNLATGTIVTVKVGNPKVQ